jgi:hypothetical protein
MDKKKMVKTKRKVSKLKSWLNPDPEGYVQNNQPGRELILERSSVALNMTGHIRKSLIHLKKRITIRILRKEQNGGRLFREK